MACAHALSCSLFLFISLSLSLSLAVDCVCLTLFLLSLFDSIPLSLCYASTPGSFVTVHCVLGVRVCVRVGPGVGYVGEFGRFYSTRG